MADLQTDRQQARTRPPKIVRDTTRYVECFQPAMEEVTLIFFCGVNRDDPVLVLVIILAAAAIMVPLVLQEVVHLAASNTSTNCSCSDVYRSEMSS